MNVYLFAELQGIMVMVSLCRISICALMTYLDSD